MQHDYNLPDLMVKKVQNIEYGSVFKKSLFKVLLETFIYLEMCKPT
jgi:hypothetical protein